MVGLKQTRAIELVIAEKNPLLQSGLIKLFASDERFSLLAMAADGERFLAAVKKLSFDVGVIGWEMPFLDGRGVLMAMRDRPGAPRLVVYTGNSQPDVPRQAMALGAAGFCSKSDPPGQLLETVAAVADGRMMFPFVDVSRLTADPFSELTPRERELLSALSTGFTNAQIAGKLEISVNTVKFHLKNLYDKLGVTNRAQAVASFLRERSA
ncbi:MAG: response regulator transcription factor [Alphaproteobacteria bacterium]|nr:response regulator transcription factor [Alphaproteobacteria bacterium]